MGRLTGTYEHGRVVADSPVDVRPYFFDAELFDDELVAFALPDELVDLAVFDAALLDDACFL